MKKIVLTFEHESEYNRFVTDIVNTVATDNQGTVEETEDSINVHITEEA